MNTHILRSGTARSHEASLMACASLLASPPMRNMYQQIVKDLDSSRAGASARDTPDAHRVACVGALTDALIPGIEDGGGLLASAISDPALLSDEPEGYDHSNTLSPAALLYENLYQQVFAWIETSLGEMVQLAILIRRVQDQAGADREDAVLVGE